MRYSPSLPEKVVCPRGGAVAWNKMSSLRINPPTGGNAQNAHLIFSMY
jgi:hypothetical protein